MIVGGLSVDFAKLFLNVKRKGGYKRVTETGLWDFVAKECGLFNVITDGLALKSLYADNLDTFLASLKILSEKKELTTSRCSMDFSSSLEPFLPIKMKKDSAYVKVNWDACDSDDVFVPVKSNEDMEIYHTKCIYENDILNQESIPNANEECLMDECPSDHVCTGKLPQMVSCRDPMKLNEDNIDKDVTKRVTNAECLASVKTDDSFRKESVSVIANEGSYSTLVNKEDVYCLKRKRESAIGVLDWIHRVARDPCDPTIGSLPVSSEWKNYSTDVTWKQVLLIRDAVLLRNKDSSNDQRLNMQKRQRMHPTMYDEAENLNFRQSPRLVSAKKSPKKLRCRTVSKSTSPKDDEEKPKSSKEIPDYISSKQHQIRVNVGPKFQADVDEWTEKKSPYEVEDSKWLGTQIWPLQIPQQQQQQQKHSKNLTEHEMLIGKGRSDSCGCRFPGSMECVGNHVSEKSKRLKLELGIAYFLWRFNRMGEATSVTWKKEDEDKFRDTWNKNPVLSVGGFLDQSMKALPNKSRASLASYYFNVFLLRRRAEQNRTTPNDITSDDDIDEGEDEDEDEDAESVKKFR